MKRVKEIRFEQFEELITNGVTDFSTSENLVVGKETMFEGKDSHGEISAIVTAKVLRMTSTNNDKIRIDVEILSSARPSLINGRVVSYIKTQWIKLGKPQFQNVINQSNFNQISVNLELKPKDEIRFIEVREGIPTGRDHTAIVNDVILEDDNTVRVNVFN